MPYQLDWYIKERIIYKRFWGIVTEDELQAYYEELFDVIITGRPPIHFIANDGRIERIPLATNLSWKNRKVNTHPWLGYSISIGRLHWIIRILTIIPRKILRMRWQWFRNWQEAEEYLKKRDSTLNWENVNRNLLHED